MGAEGGQHWRVQSSATEGSAAGTAGSWRDEREEKREGKEEEKKKKEENELCHGEWSGKSSEGAMFVTLK